jgi:hypothetical protein
LLGVDVIALPVPPSVQAREVHQRGAAKILEGARVTNSAAAQTLKTVSIMAQVVVKSYLLLIPRSSIAVEA